jgi:hypothetical protein
MSGYYLNCPDQFFEIVGSTQIVNSIYSQLDYINSLHLPKAKKYVNTSHINLECMFLARLSSCHLNQAKLASQFYAF